MASTFITGDKGTRGRRGGFTLVELMIATVLSAVVFAAIFSAYLFMARNLGRLTYNEQQQTQNRRALFQFSKDVGDATSISGTPTSSSLILVLPSGNVTYSYASNKLTRTTTTTTTLLSNLVSFTFVYYPKSGTTALSGTISNPNITVFRISMEYTSAVGSSSNGTQATVSMVSPQIVLRNRPTFGQ
jgi:prepilin-type N-terminal cleavage/methylation domain-containing protein